MLRCRRTRTVAKSERTETSDTFTGEGGGGGRPPKPPPPRATTHGKVEVSELSPGNARAHSLTPASPASPVSISPLINYLGPENGRQPKWGVSERSCRGKAKPENTTLLNESGKRPSPPAATSFHFHFHFDEIRSQNLLPNQYFLACHHLASEHE